MNRGKGDGKAKGESKIGRGSTAVIGYVRKNGGRYNGWRRLERIWLWKSLSGYQYASVMNAAISGGSRSGMKLTDCHGYAPTMTVGADIGIAGSVSASAVRNFLAANSGIGAHGNVKTHQGVGG